MAEFHCTVTEEIEEERLDKFLSETNETLSRSYLQKLIKEGAVQVNGNPVKSSYKLKIGDQVSCLVPEMKELEVMPEEIPLSILYEDSDILIINKPKGMVVHPAAGHTSGTVVNAVLFHCREDLSGINGVLRPGIVHRIDMNTTGSLVICKNDLSHRFVAQQLKEHTITRKYRAIVQGILKEDQGTINAPIGRHPTDRKRMAINHKNGKEAITHYRVLQRFQNCTYIECILETGRTHQIRVHLSSIGHPLLGDSTYLAKSSSKLQGQTLHAMTLGLIHPTTHQYLEVDAPLPEYFEKLLSTLK